MSICTTYCRACTIILLGFVLCCNTLSAQTWVQRTPVPGGPREGAIAFTIGPYIYVGGGFGKKDLHRYDTRTDSWTSVGDLPATVGQRSLSIAFTIGSRGYLCGGLSNGMEMNDLWELDSSDNVWRPLQQYPGQGFSGMVAGVIDGQAYVGGGTNTQEAVDDFYRYDPATDTWAQLRSLPVAMIFPSTFQLDSTLYVACGSTGTVQLSSLYRYDPATDTWTQGPDMPGAARNSAASFAVGGYGYVGTGLTWDSTLNRDFYRYDPVGRTWTPLGDILADLPRRGMVTAVVGDRAFLGTGFIGPRFQRTDEWRELNFTALDVDGMDGSVTTAGGLQLIPNPARDQVIVRFGASRRTTWISLFDVLGAEVLRRAIAPEQDREQLDITSLPAGLYVLRLAGSTSEQGMMLIKQ